MILHYGFCLVIRMMGDRHRQKLLVTSVLMGVILSELMDVVVIAVTDGDAISNWNDLIPYPARLFLTKNLLSMRFQNNPEIFWT